MMTKQWVFHPHVQGLYSSSRRFSNFDNIRFAGPPAAQIEGPTLSLASEVK
jgi:hypothetical protein